MLGRNKYTFVYQTVNQINGKSYVGVHSTNAIEDGYIGCGIYSDSDARLKLLFHKAVSKYGYSAFKRHILSFYDTYIEALEEEKFIVDSRWVKSKSNYNTAIGGAGNTTSWMCEGRKTEWRNNISIGVRKWVASGGYEKIKASVPYNAKKMFGKDNPMFGNGNPYVERSVIQYDKNGLKIKEYKKITDAATELGLHISAIVYCCKGRYKTSGGYVFKYKEVAVG